MAAPVARARRGRILITLLLLLFVVGVAPLLWTSYTLVSRSREILELDQKTIQLDKARSLSQQIAVFVRSQQQQIQAMQEEIAFMQRQLGELAAGASRTERDAIIVVDKANAPGGKVRLNYLVNSAGWRPQYKLRAGAEKDPVQVEYLAALTQQTGEDWSGVDVVLSTAQPLLSASATRLSVLRPKKPSCIPRRR